MAPTLEDQDRLIVNKLAYRIGDPRRGDIVMLYYPLNPDKSFVKRVIAEEGDSVRIVDGRVYVNDVPLHGRLRPGRVPQPRRLGPAGHSRGLLLRDGRPPEQQLRQPALGHGAEEVHHRQGAAPLVAGARRPASSDARMAAARAAPEPGSRVPHRRYTEVARVLVRVLVLNLVVALAKMAYGYCERRDQHPVGRLPLADRHGLERRRAGRRARRAQAAGRGPPVRPPQVRDGRRRSVIVVFLVLVMVEVLRNAFDRLRHGGAAPPSSPPASS